MVLQLQLEERKQCCLSQQISRIHLWDTCSRRAVQTHKVILDAQPLGALLLQEPLQQVPAGVGHVGFEHRRLVQDVVVHLSGVATVERWL